MKKVICFIFVAMMVSVSFVIAGENAIDDVQNGNGIRARSDRDFVVFHYEFSSADPSTKGGRVKYAFEYNGSSKDEGFYLARGGEVFVGVLAYRGGIVESEPFTVPARGKGPVIIKFRNPVGSVPLDCNVSVSLDNKRKQFLCIPWECKRLQFAKDNPQHPNGEPRTFIRLNPDGTISDLVDEARNAGWEVVSVYYADQMRGVDDPGYNVFD